MKKVGIILVNLFLMILVIIGAEFYSYLDANKLFEQKIPYFRKKTDTTVETLKTDENMRKPCGLEYKKKSILIYGCSVAYGFALSDEESFGNRLSEFTKRPVYNFAMSAKGLQHAYFLLKNDEKISPEPEYVFYVFINDHLRRMFVDCNRIDNLNYLTYRVKNGELVENRQGTLSDKSYLASSLKNMTYYGLKNIFKNQIFDLANLYIVSMKNEIKSKYPSTKFVLIDYDNGYYSELTSERIARLEKEGVEVIVLNDEFDDKLKMDSYKNPVQKDIFRHPNGKAWELVVKYLSQKYNL